MTPSTPPSRTRFVDHRASANKAKLIRTALGLHQLDPEFCRRDLLLRHPTAWLIEIDGFIVDARALPAHIRPKPAAEA